MPWSPAEPYNALPALPPATEIETKRVLKAVVAARSSLAALNASCETLPDPHVLINAITLLEAKSSSEIENIVTTNDAMFLYADPARSKQADPATREALRYRTALERGMESITQRPLSARTAQEICTTLAGRAMTVRNLPGTFISSSTSYNPRYTPPTGSTVIRDHLSHWEKFIHTDTDLDPLLRMSMAHYQFEAIHPFADGNGRTGRILNILLLATYELLTYPVLYLSERIIETKNDYYDTLLRVTSHNEWEAWNLYMLEAIKVTADRTLVTSRHIHTLQQDFHKYLREATGTVNADLLALLFVKPYCRITDVMEACRVSRPTASGMLKALLPSGRLHKEKLGREALFVNVPLMRVLARAEAFPGTTN
ncbi:Fic family protein [Klugiella xanthotipulae]|uniref:Fic family protein n=1 Tax=Klugiella xanthotipulae TaxID=244735 RepID=A0A543I6N0_9MICO|nr:Fic/DOC family N-terminal domain-containing protein [Klugiella xanthotipulae]TQM66201.1 Fic family protein [Klugiella xanthotipulae]